jgi:hypothetical protein
MPYSYAAISTNSLPVEPIGCAALKARLSELST